MNEGTEEKEEKIDETGRATGSINKSAGVVFPPHQRVAKQVGIIPLIIARRVSAHHSE
jgi:hypothetical protein